MASSQKEYNTTLGAMGGDSMSRALRQISRSPFSRHIEDVELLRRFTQLTFIMYNGKTNPVEHVSHFNQRMTIHSRTETLMCKVFPSSLDPTAMRWFDGLKEGSIRLYEELTRAFGTRFVTCSKIPMNSNLRKSLTMKPTRDMHQLMDFFYSL